MLKLKLKLSKPKAIGANYSEIKKPKPLKLSMPTKDSQEHKLEGIKNPYIEETKRMSITKLVDVWKIGFERLKNKKLIGDDLLRYKAVKSILTFKHRIEIPKDGK